ncbi:MAG: histidinol dehydrogenase [Reichenbachiella sp.]|uniref:histidinol dehydrogenase n=1 Tax=Reichenbachiella sp. TaxID=2184521 RepID=UPI00296703AA|nr:histidinol dehydrogenase [Reichenbachiella sp.]MDW3208296.1 histidinol dehydrogenase [Reichenbachiella sp.]
MILAKNPDRKDWDKLTKRPALKQQNLQQLVNEVFQAIQEEGDRAVLSYTKIFDKAEVETLKATPEELASAGNRISDDLKAAIRLAGANIEKFHRAQTPQVVEVETVPGVKCWQEVRSIERVGIYIPGGTAPLFSTVLMLAIPAQIAGCKDIVLCTPPDKNGQINPAILFAAQYAGVTQVFKVGGIQAIGSMTFGTESIPKVNKIFGPGNQYVTAAKQRATQLGVAIDMPAGPSELLVLADETANAEFVVSDLLSQAEHGTDSQVICVVKSASLIPKIQEQLLNQLPSLPRKDIARKAIENSKLILMEDDQACLDFINEYAPEHFILCVENESFYLNGLMNAGSVFIGNYTPESAGDYASGTNHTLPTNGFAKSFSGVNIDAFCKKITFQKITEEGIRRIGPAIEFMAEAEQLKAHKLAVTKRLLSL